MYHTQWHKILLFFGAKLVLDSKMFGKDGGFPNVAQTPFMESLFSKVSSLSNCSGDKSAQW